MKTIYLIGMGPGDPKYLTQEAIETIRHMDVFFMLDKEGRGKEQLIASRLRAIASCRHDQNYRIVHAHSPQRKSDGIDYQQDVESWHAHKIDIFANLLEHDMTAEQSGALLIWGDPSLYDQTVSMLNRLRATRDDFEFQIIPGITSIQMLTARHKIPLNRIGESITITTGRQLKSVAHETVSNSVVMLDADCGFQAFRDEPFDLYWGGYLGLEHECLSAGPIAEVCDQIIALRSQAREAHGWIMDIYLLRRRIADDATRMNQSDTQSNANE